MPTELFPDEFMRKIRKCSTCDKPLADGYVKKTCELCLEKAKAKYTVERANRELERENQKFVRSLLKEGLPEVYWHFSTYQEFWSNQNVEKSYEDYQKEVEEWQRNHIRAKADKQTDMIHHKNINERRVVSKFLRPDLYPFTDKERCKEFRFQKLGLHAENDQFLTDHTEEDFCDGCKEWFYQLKNSTWENHLLQSEPDEEGNYLVAFIIYPKEVRDEAFDAVSTQNYEDKMSDAEFCVLWKAKEEEFKAKIKEYLADSVMLQLDSKKDDKIWKVNVFCDPDKIKPLPEHQPSGCVGTAWGRPHEEPKGDNLWNSNDESWKS